MSPKRSPRARSLVTEVALAGLIVSVTFPLAEMVGYAIAYGPEDVLLPVRQLAAIALGEQALEPGFSVVAVLIVGGVVLNVALNVAFCAFFVGAVLLAPRLAATDRRLVSAATAFGVLLWLFNFYVFTPLVGWDWFPDLHDPIVEAVAHTVFFGVPLGVHLARRAPFAQPPIATSGRYAGS